MEKPKILSKFKVKYCGKEITITEKVIKTHPYVEAGMANQNAADVAYYEPLIQQAKRDVATRIMEMAKHEFEHWEGSDVENFIYSNYLEDK